VRFIPYAIRSSRTIRLFTVAEFTLSEVHDLSSKIVLSSATLPTTQEAVSELQPTVFLRSRTASSAGTLPAPEVECHPSPTRSP
jgi:hypothetical protein